MNTAINSVYGLTSKRFCFDDFMEQIDEEIQRKQLEEEERKLTDAITKYDFVVSSPELKNKLESILPEGANIICCKYIEDQTTIYAIKKLDVMDYLAFHIALERKKEEKL